MTIHDRLDPALRHLLGARTDLSAELLPAVRDGLDQRRRDGRDAVDCAGVDITDGVVAENIPVRTYAGGTAGTVVYCHGGAFVLGNLDTDHRQCVELARRAEATVISVDYRLAPEHPYPAGLDDVLTVLRWAAAHTGTDRLALAGNSAGGALAAGLAQRSAAGAAPAVVFTLLHQPVLDIGLTPSKQEFDRTPGFDGPATELMWRHYLAGERPVPGAVPARVADLSGLAPTFISCSELDPLRDEAVDYALRLMWAGVATELYVVPGTCHGFDSMVPDWDVSGRLFELQGAALRRAFS
ncbi:alpha/beta hydrolase [Mycolicibacterium bacteremicum]|uniref:Alpha/beta hydrolase n=1 Tax=Mycolicibacterium bacteremicum TaxID=564198 RepID=A0A1W9YPV4_MYCBA|nr:alpha/beta hydrolase [Mycolicibacterium bacteremicum]MCV7434453.1 alpha/beta hydrolase [Mycolicibacterium bacteremicum]ORA02063.1 alpha/beta hydrolase [Mycolicibacterium bacteremicum]